ncbi:MAG: YIP1 family protein [Gemmatimonadota bacterium]
MSECGHCGFDVRSGDDACPLCGTPVTAVAAPARPVPWEDPEVGFASGLWRTWKQSVIAPGEFFGGVDWNGPLGRPILYYLLLGVISALFSLLWIFAGVSDPFGGTDVGLEPRRFGLFVFFLSPFLGLLVLGMQTLVYHLFVAMLARDRRPMSATARAVSYAAGPAAFTAVPLLGALMAGIWTIVMVVFGLRAAHRTTTGRAVVVVILPFVLAVVLVLGFFLLLLVAVSGLTEL